MADPKCYVLVRGRNAQPFVERCLQSIESQTYGNLTVLFIDDASDYTKQLQKKIEQSLKGHICIWQKERKYSLRNAYDMIHTYCQDPEGVVINLDADDWFANPQAVSFIAKQYQKENCVYAYGDCLLWNGLDSDHLPRASQAMNFCNQPYSKEIIRQRSYRDNPFLPLHPRTWKVKAFKLIKKSSFLRSDGSWIQFCEDQAIYYPIFEMFGKHGKVFSEPLVVYNQANTLADMKINTFSTLRDELEIRRKERYEPINL